MKKLLAILALSTLILVGCTDGADSSENSDTSYVVDTTLDSTEVVTDTTITVDSNTID